MTANHPTSCWPPGPATSTSCSKQGCPTTTGTSNRTKTPRSTTSPRPRHRGRAPGGGSADRAVADATAAQWEAERALARGMAGAYRRPGRCRRRAAWNDSVAARVDAAEDAISALRAATAGDRAALGDLLARNGRWGAGRTPPDRPGRRAERSLGVAVRSGRAAAGRALRSPGLHRAPRALRPRPQRPARAGRAATDPRVTGPARHWTDHRAKHQSPGLTMAMTADGTLAVTTPSGITATTEPPPF
jgi:hypothetical protein